MLGCSILNVLRTQERSRPIDFAVGHPMCNAAQIGIIRPDQTSSYYSIADRTHISQSITSPPSLMLIVMQQSH